MIKRYDKRHHKQRLKIIIIFIFSISFYPSVLDAKKAVKNTNAITFKNEMYFINYNSTPLTKIFHDLEDAFQIRIIQLNRIRYTKNFSLSLNADSIEGILKKLITSIGENNYAFSYTAGKLSTVFFASSTEETTTVLQKIAARVPPKPPKKLGAVVTSANTGPDERFVELIPGDIIIEYNGNKITGGPLELINLMKKKTDLIDIEIKILRDSLPVNIFVHGGMLDIGLKTVILEDDFF